MYTLINILGLAVGMACALMISIYMIHETSFDNFHTDADRIFRITVDGNLRERPLRIAVTSAPMAKVLNTDFPELESSLRVAKFGAWLISNNGRKYNEDNFLFADSNFFSFYSFRLISGNPDSALKKPHSIVLTKSTALKYFDHYNVAGQKLKIETFNEPFTITGVTEDVPANSHFHFDMIGSLSSLEKYLRDVWVSHNVYTYIKVKEGTDIQQLGKDINLLVDKYVVPEVEEHLNLSKEDFKSGNYRISYVLQPLRKIHLHSNLDIEHEANGKALYVYAFGIIALLILFIACLNFINLSTANSSNRAREVVLRKTIGSEKRLLILQFLTESVLFSFLALVLALLIAEIAMPYFNRYLSVDLGFGILRNATAVALIILITLLFGVAAGLYPAFFISSFDPVKVLHGSLNSGLKNRKVRSFFVAIQFFISILIIIVTLAVIAQVDFMLNKELGFAKERILVVRRSDALKERIDDFKTEILKHPNIESVSNSNSIPGRDFLASTYIFGHDSVRRNIFMNQVFVSYDFMEAFKLKLIEGRFFSPSILADTVACVINETAAKNMGVEKVIGTVLEAPVMKTGINKLKVIGVVKDFHFESVDKPIQPLIMSLMPGNWEGYLNVRLSTTGIDKAIKYLEDTWEKYTQEYPFLYFFLEKDFDNNYRSVVRTSRILTIFSVLSVFVALLGLFGLIIYTSNQRLQELGIRKALGATYLQVMYLLMKETFLLIVYASVAAWLIAYLFLKFWLKDFYVRIELSPGFFLISTGLVLVLSMLVVLYQCYHAARTDPATALNTE